MDLKQRGKFWHYDFGLDGRRYRGSTRETSQTKAERKAHKLMAQIQSGNEVKRSPRLIDFESKFTTAVEKSSLKPKTKRYYKYGWKLLKNTPLSQMRLDRITRDQADAVSFPGSSSYKGQALRTLRVMLGKAVAWGYLAKTPKIKLPKHNRRHAVIAPDQERALLAKGNVTLRVALLMVQDLGLRPDEISRARIETINWQTLIYFNPDGKTEKSRRFIPISKRLFEALFIYCKDRKEGWLFPSKRAKSGHVHPDSLSHWFNEARVAAGLPSDLVLYSGRHTFGTDVLAGTGNLAAAMDVMGHTDPRMLMVYQHPQLEQVRTAIDTRNASNAAQALEANRLTN